MWATISFSHRQHIQIPDALPNHFPVETEGQSLGEHSFSQLSHHHLGLLPCTPYLPNYQLPQYLSQKPKSVRISSSPSFPISNTTLVQFILPQHFLNLSISFCPDPGHLQPLSVSLIFLPLIFPFPILSLHNDSSWDPS